MCDITFAWNADLPAALLIVREGTFCGLLVGPEAARLDMASRREVAEGLTAMFGIGREEALVVVVAAGDLALSHQRPVEMDAVYIA